MDSMICEALVLSLCVIPEFLSLRVEDNPVTVKQEINLGHIMYRTDNTIRVTVSTQIF